MVFSKGGTVAVSTMPNISPYCCQDFKDLLDDNIIEEDKGELRSNGCFVREKYLLHVHDCLLVTMDMYIKYCPRCGAVLTTIESSS